MEWEKRPTWQVALFVAAIVLCLVCLAGGALLAVLTAIGPIVVTLTPSIEGPAQSVPSATPAAAAAMPLQPWTIMGR